MKDFFENKKDHQQMLTWCENNLFKDSRDYISRRSVVDYDNKSNLEVFLSLSVTTWMLIINDKINEEDFPLLKKEGKENAMRSIMLFILKLSNEREKT
jgi:hypothetical protein